MGFHELSFRNFVSVESTTFLQFPLIYYWFFLHRNLQVVEAAKRRGLGRILVKMYCKAFVKQENLDPIAYIVEENHISRKLFDSLGFQVYRRSYWLKLKTSH